MKTYGDYERRYFSVQNAVENEGCTVSKACKKYEATESRYYNWRRIQRLTEEINALKNTVLELMQENQTLKNHADVE